MITESNLYLGVEGVLIREVTDDTAELGRLEMVPGAEAFLKWAVMRFDCRWLTSLNADGGDDRIRHAFSRVIGASWSPEDLGLLFELVQPTFWEDAMVEAINLDGDFNWIADEIDTLSGEVLQRRGLMGRVKFIAAENGIEEFTRLQCELPAC